MEFLRTSCSFLISSNVIFMTWDLFLLVILVVLGLVAGVTFVNFRISQTSSLSFISDSMFPDTMRFSLRLSFSRSSDLICVISWVDCTGLQVPHVNGCSWIRSDGVWFNLFSILVILVSKFLNCSAAQKPQ